MNKQTKKNKKRYKQNKLNYENTPHGFISFDFDKKKVSALCIYKNAFLCVFVQFISTCLPVYKNSRLQPKKSSKTTKKLIRR